MIVQAFDVRVSLTVAHSGEVCDGSIGLVYRTAHGATMLGVECTRPGCKPIVIGADCREPTTIRT